MNLPAPQVNPKMSFDTPAALRVALAGNPNSGKTSLFNALTGAHQRVGNYPGITVEKRSGSYEHEGKSYAVQDLPGTYSLTSYSPEERVTQQELVEHGHDVVIVVADSNNLNRGLVLLAQVMQLGISPVLCLNMADEARQAGQRLDLQLMCQLLGFPVIETVGHRAEGVEELKAAVAMAAAAETTQSAPRLVLGERLDGAIEKITADMPDATFPKNRHAWIASRLLVDDTTITLPRPALEKELATAIATARNCRAEIERDTGLDINLFATERYFGFIDGLLREVTTQRPRADARASSDRIDSVLVHRFFGLPIFAAIMFGIFWVTFTLGEIPMGWIESGFELMSDAISSAWPEDTESPLRSLLVDGIIGGVGGVIVFVPNIILLFVGLALLEDTGYMARVAFLMDRVMHRFGLHGKSFVPMLTGFGCSIPGIMATRTLENERDRLVTMLVLPLMSCGARLPIWMLLVPAFFPLGWRAPILWLIYVIGVAAALLLALALRRTILAGDEAPFVMELPPYRMPTARAVAMKMSERAWIYIRKAGTIILGISILMWGISTYPKLESFEIDARLSSGEARMLDITAPDALNPDDAEAWVKEGVERAQASVRAAGESAVTVYSAAEVENMRASEALAASIAGHIGALVEPVLSPLGFDQRLATAMLGAFAAKEVFVAQLGIVYSMGETDEGSDGLRGALHRDYTPLVGISLMLFLLIATPCMATVAVTRRESGSWKWAMLQLGGLTGVAYLVSLIVFQVGTMLGY